MNIKSKVLAVIFIQLLALPVSAQNCAISGQVSTNVYKNGQNLGPSLLYEVPTADEYMLFGGVESGGLTGGVESGGLTGDAQVDFAHLMEQTCLPCNVRNNLYHFTHIAEPRLRKQCWQRLKQDAYSVTDKDVYKIEAIAKATGYFEP